MEPGYNDIGLCDTSPITLDILWFQLIPVNHNMVITTLVYNEREYSVKISLLTL